MLYVALSHFYVQSKNFCLIFGVFKPFSFNTIVHMVMFKSTILLFVYYVYNISFFSFFFCLFVFVVFLLLFLWGGVT